MMAISYGFLVLIDFVPETPTAEVTETVLEAEVEPETDEINAEDDFETIAQNDNRPKSPLPEQLLLTN